MQSLNFYIGFLNPLIPVLVDQPDNWQALMIELGFENNSPEAVLNATKLIWKGQTAGSLNTYVKNGISGGLGIFEGIPLVIKVCNSQEVVFDGIIDLTDPETKFSCDIIQCKIRDKRMDMVNQLMNSVSFAYLATPISQSGAGIINPKPQSLGGDYVVIPYQRNDIPDHIQVLMLGFLIYNVTEKIEDAGTRLGQLVGGDTAAAAIDTADVLNGFDATVLGIFEIIGFVVYIAVMVDILYQLIKEAFNYLVSPVYTKFGMNALTMIQKACSYFGITFQSTILQNAPFNNLVIMPQKTAWSDNRSFVNTLFSTLSAGSTVNQRMEYDDLYNWTHNGNSTNFGAYGYYDGTPGDLLRALEEMFNAKAKIIMNNLGQPVLHFERWDYQYALSTYTLPNISDQVPFNSKGLFNSTGYSQSAFATNASEIPSNYEVSFQLDQQDLNTYNSYEGNRCFCTTRPITISAVKNVLLQHLVQRNIPFAHAFRKDQNTTAEIILTPIWSAAANIINIVGAVINLFIGIYNFIVSNVLGLPPLQYITPISSQPPFSLKGHMLLTEHTTTSPKIFIASSSQSYASLPFGDWQGRSFTGVTIDPNNRGQVNMSLPNISSRALMRDFHYSSLPQTLVPANPSFATPYAPGSPYFNQYLMYKNQQIPMCCSEYSLVKNNNEITTFDGRKAKVLSLRWNIFKGMADLDYKIQQQYTKNLQTTFTIDGKIVTNAL